MSICYGDGDGDGNGYGDGYGYGDGWRMCGMCGVASERYDEKLSDAIKENG